MNRRAKISVWSMLLVLILIGITPVFGQAQGYDLYKKLTAERRSLISFDGSAVFVGRLVRTVIGIMSP